MSYTTMNIDFSGTASRFCKSTLLSFACRENLYSQSSQSVSRLDPALQTIPAGCFRHEDYAGGYPKQLSFNVPQTTLPIAFLLTILSLKIPFDNTRHLSRKKTVKQRPSFLRCVWGGPPAG